MPKTRTVIVSLGGSLIVPDKIDRRFLARFRQSIERFISAPGRRVIIVTGGGGLNRTYNAVASTLARPRPMDLDWLGIATTKVNAELVRILFGNKAHPRILGDPHVFVKTSKKILVGAGWEPGRSTDFDAVVLARTYGATEVINLTNIDKVYTADPKLDPKAVPVDEVTWREYLTMIPQKWTPRLNTPFDPVASRMASRLNLRVAIINGRKMIEFERFLARKPFQGSFIHPSLKK
ncbi:MAG: UMP kinase [bacterium]|nr:UMP kinase [bacterium]